MVRGPDSPRIRRFLIGDINYICCLFGNQFITCEDCVCVPDWESIFHPFVDQTLNTMIQNYVTQFLFNFNETSSKKDE